MYEDLIRKFGIFYETHPSIINIAIQVPDSLLSKVISLFNEFSKHFPGIFFFIVADSSFNDCCVDHISAQHLNADALIHFGSYCYSKYSIPVCFLPNPDYTAEIPTEILSDVRKFINNTSVKNLLIFDQSGLQLEYLKDLCTGPTINIFYLKEDEDINNSESNSFATTLFDFNIPLPQDSFNDTAIIYLGPHLKLATDIACIFYHTGSLRINTTNWTIWDNPIVREMSKRFQIFESISNFDHIGIIIENPNIMQHVQLANILQGVCLSNNIFSSIIYVGRLNELKLGNFSDIQAFVHISCIGKPLFSFYQPVISPFEFLCSKLSLNYWDNQILRDNFKLINYCSDVPLPHLNLPSRTSMSCENRLLIKDFYELSAQIFDSRKNFSFNGLEINSSDKNIRLHLGSTGNSTFYDYEKTK